MSKEIVLVGACRTAIGKMGGTLSNIPAEQLGAIVMKEAIARAGISADQIDEVIFGNVLTAAMGQSPARQAAIHAGIPESVPAMTINNVCGSGLKSVNMAAAMIMAGEADVIMAGGMENMSMAPYALPNARFGYRMNNGKVIDTMVNDALWDAFNNYHMGITAENVAEKYGITREMQDEFAAASQQKTEAAQKAGLFDAEIVGVPVKVKKETIMFYKDEFPRAGVEAAGLAKLKPAFVMALSVIVVISSPSSCRESGLYAARQSFSVSFPCSRFDSRSVIPCIRRNSSTSAANCTATAAVSSAASARTSDSPAPTASSIRPSCQADRNCAADSRKDRSSTPAPPRTAGLP